MKPRRLTALLIACLLLAAAGCGGGGDDDSGDGGDNAITFWSAEDNAERVKVLQGIVDEFQTKSGVQVKLVTIAEDQLASQIQSASAAGSLPDVMGSLSLGFAHSLAADDLADGDAANEVIESLGRDTFSERALSLVQSDGKPISVPADTWTQLLVYRKDLFEKEGLETPDTFEKIQAAATKLNGSGSAGIVAATKAADGFTQQTFEYFALANGCQLTDDQGGLQLTTPPCVETFQFYSDLINNGSTKGGQDADTTRAAYFSGKAGMIIWSSFLLDELAGLRNDALPTCPQCREDKTWLAENSGVVTAISGPSGSEPTQFGEVTNFSIIKDGNTEPAKQFVEYMMSDGYVRWLGLSPQGKYPVRAGDSDDPQKFAKAWAELESGIDRKAPLSDFYSEASIASLGEGVANFQRWGFAQGQGALVGKLAEKQPVSNAVGEVIRGRAPEAAAKDVQAAVEKLKSGR